MVTRVGICKLFIFDELLVAQNNVRSVGKTIESLVIEFDHASFEVHFLGYESPKIEQLYR